MFFLIGHKLFKATKMSVVVLKMAKLVRDEFIVIQTRQKTLGYNSQVLWKSLDDILYS